MRVDVYTLLAGRDEKIGSILYQGGKITTDPPHDPTLERIARKPVFSGGQVVEPSQGRAFLAALHRQYGSAYLRATQPYNDHGEVGGLGGKALKPTPQQPDKQPRKPQQQAPQQEDPKASQPDFSQMANPPKTQPPVEGEGQQTQPDLGGVGGPPRQPEQQQTGKKPQPKKPVPQQPQATSQPVQSQSTPSMAGSSQVIDWLKTQYESGTGKYESVRAVLKNSVLPEIYKNPDEWKKLLSFFGFSPEDAGTDMGWYAGVIAYTALHNSKHGGGILYANPALGEPTRPRPPRKPTTQQPQKSPPIPSYLQDMARDMLNKIREEPIGEYMVKTVDDMLAKGTLTMDDLETAARIADDREMDDENKAVRNLIRLARGETAGGEIDWRPNETIPEDYYALANPASGEPTQPRPPKKQVAPRESPREPFAPLPHTPLVGKDIAEKLTNFTDGDRIVQDLIGLGDEETNRAYFKAVQDHQAAEVNYERAVREAEDRNQVDRGHELVAKNPDIVVLKNKQDEASRIQRVAYEKSLVQAEQARKRLIETMGNEPTSQYKFNILNDNTITYPLMFTLSHHLEVALNWMTSMTRKLRDSPDLPTMVTIDRYPDTGHMVSRPFWSRATHPEFSGVIGLTFSCDAAAITHELGHMMEDNIPGVREACLEFLKYRVGDEAPTDMGKKFPGFGYGEHHNVKEEYGRKDNFDVYFGPVSAYYVGKELPDGVTEILSMGLEAMYRDPIGFSQADPEYFKFVLGILGGVIRGEKPPTTTPDQKRGKGTPRKKKKYG